MSSLRIVTLAQNVPGPAAVARLAAEGASVVKIEPPWGDPLAALSRAWYAELHAGVSTITLDLKTPEGMQALRVRMAAADLLIASHRPAALERLGLDAISVRAEFPALRHLNIVGDTTRPNDAGHDLTYQARAGLLGSGLPATLIADLAGAERAYAAVIGLMQDAPGSHRVVGLLDSLQAFAAPMRHGLTAAGGPLGGGDPAYALYAAKTGVVAVAALEPHFRSRLYDRLGMQPGTRLDAIFATRSAPDWEEWAAALDIPIVAVRP